MKNWMDRAIEVKEVYGSFVDWEEEFYICPFCEEPIYKDDWTNEDFSNFICPICEDEEE